MDDFYEDKEQEPIYYTITEIDEIIKGFKEGFKESYYITIMESLEELRENIRLNPKFKIRYETECVIKSYINNLDTINKTIEKINFLNIKIDIINKKIDVIISKIVNNENYGINDYNADKIVDSNLILLYKYRDDLHHTKIKLIENKFIDIDEENTNYFYWRKNCIENLLNAIH